MLSRVVSSPGILICSRSLDYTMSPFTLNFLTGHPLPYHFCNISYSTQEANIYVTGGSEEEWMNRLADAMIPYLDASDNLSFYHILNK